MYKKIILGTAQLGMNYGITNKRGKLNSIESKNLLKKALSFGIKTLDTAQNYGDAENLIGQNKSFCNQFQINTKIEFSKEELNSCIPLNSMSKKLDLSLARMKTRKIHSLLVHNGEKLNNKSIGLFEWIKDCKFQNKINTFGASIYQDSNIDIEILNELDFIQVPFSLFNQEIENNKIISHCLENSIDIHVRSIFSQGLVLCDSESLPEWTSKLDRDLFKEIKRLALVQSIPMLNLACSFVQSKDWVKAITIGVTSIAELREIVQALSSKEVIKEDLIISLCKGLSKKFIDPRRW